MKKLVSILSTVLATGVMSLTLACSKPPDTPESARIAEIQAEIKEIDAKLAANPMGDDADNLRDKKMELLAEHSNIMQKADKNRRE